MEQDRTAQQEEQLVEAPSTAPNPAEQEGAETQSGGPSSPSVPPTMLAAIYHRYGSPKEIELNSEHPRPRIVRKTDVLIRVHATSINPIDWKMMAGKLSIAQFGKIFPFVPCFDVSGVVAEVGSPTTATAAAAATLSCLSPSFSGKVWPTNRCIVSAQVPAVSASRRTMRCGR